MHMVGVWNGIREPRINSALIKRLLGIAKIFIGVNRVMKGCEVVPIKHQRLFVEMKRVGSACLAVSEGRVLSGETALNQQPWIAWINLDRVVDGLLVRGISCGV